MSWTDAPPSLGMVPTEGRGSLPFAVLDDLPLVAHAAEALQAAGVQLLDFNVSLSQVQSSGRPLVVHDPLCPLTPPGFLTRAVEVALDDETVVVAVRPVTDTVKTVRDGVLGRTVDRDRLWSLASPLVLPATAQRLLHAWSDLDDPVALVDRLRRSVPVELLAAPAAARRVEDHSALALLAASTPTEGSA